MSVSQPIMTVATPMVHIVPYKDNKIYHDQGDNTNQRNLMEDLQEQFNKIQLEVKAIRGKDLFGKNAQELCLVPSVQIPAKFKVPDFEKYKGSSFPQSHLVMYARKTSTYADNHQLLIHRHKVVSLASKTKQKKNHSNLSTRRPRATDALIPSKGYV